jgi:hypothetical protein
MAQQIPRPPHLDSPTTADHVACNFGPRREDPVLARQLLAGEEDQSVPGWDQGA